MADEEKGWSLLSVPLAPYIGREWVSYADLPPGSTGITVGNYCRELLVLWWAEANNTHKEVYFYAYKYRSG